MHFARSALPLLLMEMFTESLTTPEEETVTTPGIGSSTRTTICDNGGGHSFQFSGATAPLFISSRSDWDLVSQPKRYKPYLRLCKTAQALRITDRLLPSPYFVLSSVRTQHEAHSLYFSQRSCTLSSSTQCDYSEAGRLLWPMGFPGYGYIYCLQCQSAEGTRNEMYILTKAEPLGPRRCNIGFSMHRSRRSQRQHTEVAH